MIPLRCRRCAEEVNTSAIQCEFNDLLDIIKFKCLLCDKCFKETKIFVTNNTDSYVDDEYE